jgi:hypothetical protein
MTKKPRKAFNPRKVLHSLCRDFEIPTIDVPQSNLTRVKLTTQTSIVNTAIRFDDDLGGLQHYTPLARVDEEDRGAFAEMAIRNPPREITPVLNAEGIAGIQGAKSYLPRTEPELEALFLDVFGRIANYTDKDLPSIIAELRGRKAG